MKPLFLKLMLPALLALVMVACGGGGGGGFAGIGGSGYVSTGTVTGFGSVIVNGVKFSTVSSTFEVEDDGVATQDDLSIGMVVQVEGVINADGVTGTAEKIHFGDDLEGPISSPVLVSLDGNTKTLDIMGITVLVNSADTKFYDKNGLPDPDSDPLATFTGLAEGNVLEISGYYDASDVLHASYVKLKATGYTSTIEFEVTGRIKNLSGSTFNLRGMYVDATNASLSDFDNGLQNGLYVEVKGTFDGSQLQVLEVEREEIDLVDDGSEVSIEGYITNFNSTSDFRINGYLVNASGATLEPASLNLRDGIVVEAEGSVSNGIFYATEVESEEGDSEVSAYVNSVDVINSWITVEVVTGQPSVTVQVTTDTKMEDYLDDVLTLSELVFEPDSARDFVEVKGFETSPGTITATLLKRVVAGDIELQGVVRNQIEDESVEVLGVIFPVDGLSTDPTEYVDEIEQPFGSHFDFINNTVDGQSIISIKDKNVTETDSNAVGTADTVEIEIP